MFRVVIFALTYCCFYLSFVCLLNLCFCFDLLLFLLKYAIVLRRVIFALICYYFIEIYCCVLSLCFCSIEICFCALSLCFCFDLLLFY